jgi:hypothetical protein
LTDELVARKNQQAVDNVIARLRENARIKIESSALGFTYTGELGHN